MLIFTSTRCCGKQGKCGLKRAHLGLWDRFSLHVVRLSSSVSLRNSAGGHPAALKLLLPGDADQSWGWQKHSTPSWWLCTSASSPLFIKGYSHGRAVHVQPTYTRVVYDTGAILTAAVCFYRLTRHRGD